MTKNETPDAVIIWLFTEFRFHSFSFACWRIKFLLSIFLLLIAIFIFYQWWQIIKLNAVLFTKKSRCGRVMMNEWLIMSGLMENYNLLKWYLYLYVSICFLKNFSKLLKRRKMIWTKHLCHKFYRRLHWYQLLLSNAEIFKRYILIST